MSAGGFRTRGGQVGMAVGAMSVERLPGGWRTLGLALVMLSGFAGSSLGIGGKYAVLGGASPTTIQVIRFTLGAAVLWLVLPLAGRQMRLPRNLALAFLAMGMVFQTGEAYGFFGALQYVSAGATVLLFFLFPALVTAASMAMGRERFTWGRVVAVGMALLGCALVVGGPGAQIVSEQAAARYGAPAALLTGTLLGLLAAVSIAIYVLIGDRLLARSDPLVAAAHVQAGAAAAMLIVTATLDPVRFDFTPAALLAILVMTLLANLGGVVVFLIAIRYLGGPLAAVGGMTEVVVTVVLGVILFGESFGPGTALGAALVLGGIALMQRERLRDSPPVARQVPVAAQAAAEIR